MKKLTREELTAFATTPTAEPADWIRVQLDTGGVAAGAETVYAALARAREERMLTFALQRAGSIGYSFADPVVEVQIAACRGSITGRLPRRSWPGSSKSIWRGAG